MMRLRVAVTLVLLGTASTAMANDRAEPSSAFLQLVNRSKARFMGMGDPRRDDPTRDEPKHVAPSIAHDLTPVQAPTSARVVLPVRPVLSVRPAPAAVMKSELPEWLALAKVHHEAGRLIK